MTDAGKLADECDRIAAFPIEQMPVYQARGVLKQAAAALRTPPTGNAMREDEDWNIRKYVDFLRADEGDSVTLACTMTDEQMQHASTAARKASEKVIADGRVDPADKHIPVGPPPLPDSAGAGGVSALGKEYLERRVASMREAVDRQEWRQNDGDESKPEYWIGRLHEAQIALNNLAGDIERISPHSGKSDGKEPPSTES